MPELLEVLRTAADPNFGVFPAGRKAITVQRDLAHSLELLRQLDARHVEHCGRDVDGVAEGGPDGAAVVHTRRPLDDQRIAHAAAISVLLVPAKGGVSGLRPPSRDVWVRVRPADVIEPVLNDVVDIF